MPKIRVLPVNLRNKIAAGEVVERPASVVKELIENAIDALSNEIKIEVVYGGKRLIKVSDNGIGMEKEDAVLCFERHATSKITDEADLFNITTMGFRGEAIPSIASVSKVKLITGSKGSGSGVSIEMIGGDKKEVKDSPFSGTVIEVKDLFFNTPARKKFLKANSTELFHIIDIVTKEAISHSGIGFTLITDNHETMILPRASGFRERIMQVYGDEFLKGLIEINTPPQPPLNKGGYRGGMGLNAFVSGTGNFRSNKSNQFIFINNRPVKDPSVSHAVYSAYEGMLPKDKHPVFFLFLELDPKRVDFNVHPAKREVRFEDKEDIHRFVNVSIKDAVRGEQTEYTRTFSEIPAMPQSDIVHRAFPQGMANIESPEPIFDSKISENLELLYRPSLPFIFLGDTFIAVSGKGGLTLIDHHAAHERILYERFLKSIHLDSHQLLFPQQVKLSHKEYRVILENKTLLNDFGVELDDFGHDTLIIRSLPDSLDAADLRGILSDVASAIIDGVAPDKSLKEDIAARIACHKSVRGKEILNHEELSRLLSDLENTAHPDQCPHGRPTRIFFSLDDLKKMFKRK